MSYKIFAFALLTVLSLDSHARFDNFITRDGHKLMDGDKEFRFAGIHAPELHRIEDDSKGVCKADPRGWGQYFKWPKKEEQENWIKALVRTGHKAMRVYVLSIETPYDKDCGRETHILAPLEPNGMPRLNEVAMKHYDQMIALSDQHGLRLILPFVDHWKWWGGREQLADFYGEEETELHNIESKTYKAYLSIIEQVLTRKNTITGRYYYEEKAIMAWETGNELKESTEDFVVKTAAFIKKLAPSQLVVDGTYLKINEFSLDDPNVDIISNHYYTVNGNNNPEQVMKDLKAIDGKKVYFLGEFGLKDAAGLASIMDMAVHGEHNGARTAGAFIWGLRGRRYEGGFYWHREYTGHYSYHIPGFPEGEPNEEQAVVDIARKATAQMDGKKEADPLPVPEAPLLHPIASAEAINWMGAPVGRNHRIERSKKSPVWKFWQPWTEWETIAENVSDGMNKYDPDKQNLFQDPDLEAGTYRYRVYASNESGESPASNIEKLVVRY